VSRAGGAPQRGDFQPQAQLARIAVAQHLRAAGVGREVAADRAAALGGETQGEQQVLARGGFLNRLQDAAGIDGHCEIRSIDIAHAVQSRERE